MILQKCSLYKVFEVFLEEPTKIHYIKEISRKINLAHTSVKKHLDELEKVNLIVRKKGDIFQGFVANRDNKSYTNHKSSINILKVKESGLIDFILGNAYPKAVVLYGSYLKGEDIENSDIDIFLLTKVKKDLDLKKFEKILGKEIHILAENNLKKINKELMANILNGLVLEGYLE